MRVDWRIKGVIQKVLSHVPYGERVNHKLQQRGPGAFAKECDTKVDDWRIAMGLLRDAKVKLDGMTVVEIGSGWFPTFPVCLWLAGASKIITFDLTRHLRLDLTLQLAERLQQHVPLLARESGVSEGAIETRRAAFAKALAAGADLATASERAIDYRAPVDFTKSGLAADSVDLVYSNSVLEHVTEDVLPVMFREMTRILKPGNVAMHSVNCGDHYAYFDRSISQLNYLQFSDAQWRLWNNDFQYQNRLRAKEFTRLAREAGLTIEIDASTVRPQRLAELAKIKVDPKFAAAYTREELSHTNIDFIARKR